MLLTSWACSISWYTAAWISLYGTEVGSLIE